MRKSIFNVFILYLQFGKSVRDTLAYRDNERQIYQNCDMRFSVAFESVLLHDTRYKIQDTKYNYNSQISNLAN